MSNGVGTFGTTIRQLREAQSISLRKFAEMVGISPTYLSKIERDEFNPPSEEKVRTIASVLNQDPDELLGLAGRVSTELTDIIQRRPREMASVLRTVNGMSADQIKKLLSDKQKKK